MANLKRQKKYEHLEFDKLRNLLTDGSANVGAIIDELLLLHMNTPVEYRDELRLNIEMQDGGEDSYLETAMYYMREENDEEYNARVAREQEYEKAMVLKKEAFNKSKANYLNYTVGTTTTYNPTDTYGGNAV